MCNDTTKPLHYMNSIPIMCGMWSIGPLFFSMAGGQCGVCARTAWHGSRCLSPCLSVCLSPTREEAPPPSFLPPSLPPSPLLCSAAGWLPLCLASDGASCVTTKVAYSRQCGARRWICAFTTSGDYNTNIGLYSPFAVSFCRYSFGKQRF